MMMQGLKVTTPSDLSIVMTREFDAPRRLVWQAMTTPELMKKWMFCPPGWAWAVCENDLRVGGTFRWVWNGPDGQWALEITGVNKVIEPPSKVVHTERMRMGPGSGMGCAQGNDEELGELLATMELMEAGGRTTMKMTLEFASKEARDGALASGMEHGMEAGYKQLDAMLPGMR